MQPVRIERFEPFELLNLLNSVFLPDENSFRKRDQNRTGTFTTGGTRKALPAADKIQKRNEGTCRLPAF